MEFQGKKVIVTGITGESIGAQTTKQFLQAGAEVVISYRSDDRMAKQLSEIAEAAGTRCHAFYADFSSMDNVKQFAEQAIQALGHVDVLVNNAGLLYRDKILDITPEMIETVFQVNSMAPLYLAQLCAQDMQNKDIKGNIVNISSIAGCRTFTRGVVYAASKAAVNKWTENAALNLAEHGIRVNAIAPGVIESGMNQNTAQTDPELWAKFTQGISLGRPGTPEDIANSVLFLASDKAGWITGEILSVDGGHVL